MRSEETPIQSICNVEPCCRGNREWLKQSHFLHVSHFCEEATPFKHRTIKQYAVKMSPEAPVDATD